MFSSRRICLNTNQNYLTKSNQDISLKTSIKDTQKAHILITGSSGFLGSKTLDYLSKLGHTVCGIDIRDPSPYTLNMYKENDKVTFMTGDISNKNDLRNSMKKYISEKGFPTVILHLASFWNYSNKFGESYYVNNLIGTQNLIELTSLSREWNIDKFIFSSSVEVLPYIDKQGNYITMPEGKKVYHQYGLSKAQNELFLRGRKDDANIILLRIGGVFDEWCELPPLAWLFNRWSSTTAMSRIIPGRGNTKIPYIHRDNFITYIDSLINSKLSKRVSCFMVHDNMTQNLNKYTISYAELFKLLRYNLRLAGNPIYLNKDIVKFGLWCERMSGLNPPEQSWMFELIDEDILDYSNLYSYKELNNLRIDETLTIRNSVSRLVDKFVNNSDEWYVRQFERESHNYRYRE